MATKELTVRYEGTEKRVQIHETDNEDSILTRIARAIRRPGAQISVMHRDVEAAVLYSNLSEESVYDVVVLEALEAAAAASSSQQALR
eukprot:2014866-Amphidinium_carterae.1